METGARDLSQTTRFTFETYVEDCFWVFTVKGKFPKYACGS